MPPQDRDRPSIPSWQRAQNRVEGLAALITGRVWTLDLSRTTPCVYTFAPENRRAEIMAANIGGICAHLVRRIEHNEPRMMLYNDMAAKGGANYLKRFIGNYFLKDREYNAQMGRLEVILPDDMEQARIRLEEVGLTQKECETHSPRLTFRGVHREKLVENPFLIKEVPPPSQVEEAKGARQNYDRRPPEEWQRLWENLDEQARNEGPRSPLERASRKSPGTDWIPG